MTLKVKGQGQSKTLVSKSLPAYHFVDYNHIWMKVGLVVSYISKECRVQKA